MWSLKKWCKLQMNLFMKTSGVNSRLSVYCDLLNPSPLHLPPGPLWLPVRLDSTLLFLYHLFSSQGSERGSFYNTHLLRPCASLKACLASCCRWNITWSPFLGPILSLWAHLLPSLPWLLCFGCTETLVCSRNMPSWFPLCLCCSPWLLFAWMPPSWHLTNTFKHLDV